MTICLHCEEDYIPEVGLCEACGGNELIPLIRELDIKLDGATLPATASSIIMRLRSLTNKLNNV